MKYSNKDYINQIAEINRKQKLNQLWKWLKEESLRVKIFVNCSSNYNKNDFDWNYFFNDIQFRFNSQLRTNQIYNKKSKIRAYNIVRDYVNTFNNLDTNRARIREVNDFHYIVNKQYKNYII